MTNFSDLLWSSLKYPSLLVLVLLNKTYHPEIKTIVNKNTLQNLT